MDSIVHLILLFSDFVFSEMPFHYSRAPIKEKL